MIFKAMYMLRTIRELFANDMSASRADYVQIRFSWLIVIVYLMYCAFVFMYL